MARSSAGGGRDGGRGRGSGQDSGSDRWLQGNADETFSQQQISEEDESTVSRRGPVAPTPLPEPINREQICIIRGQFSNQGKATRTMGEVYEEVRSCWVKFMKRKVKDLLNRARESAKIVATNAGVEVGDNLSLIIPYKPRWMGAQIWESLVHIWNTEEWKAKSLRNTNNRGKSTGGKHTLGSQTYVTLRQKMEKELGRPATVDEIWMQSHGKKGTRPLDRLLSHRGDENLEEVDGLDVIDLQNNVEWVDSRAEDSLKSYQKHVKERYGDDASKRPLFDQDSWVQAVGGKKKGKLYGFNDISDPHFMMTDTPSIQSTSIPYLPA